MFKGCSESTKLISDKGYTGSNKLILSETDIPRCSVSKLFNKNFILEIHRDTCDGVLFK